MIRIEGIRDACSRKSDREYAEAKMESLRKPTQWHLRMNGIVMIICTILRSKIDVRQERRDARTIGDRKSDEAGVKTSFIGGWVFGITRTVQDCISALR